MVKKSAAPALPFEESKIIRKQGGRRRIRNLDLTLAILPAMLLLMIYNYLPMLGLSLAFVNFSAKDILTSPWVGLEHFKTLFESSKFYSVLGNTLIINLYRLVFQFPIPIILALCLNEVRHSLFKRTVQTLTYLPHFLSWVVLSAIFIDLLSPSTGIVNKLLGALGIAPISFMGDEKWFRTVLVVSQTFKETGWSTIIYLAAITAVNPELYESAALDGAGRFRRAVSITLPCIGDTIIFILMLRVGSALSSDTEQVLMMYNSLVYSVGDVLGTYIYREGLVGGKYSFTTAVGFFNSCIGFALMMGANFISRRLGAKGLW